MLPQKQLNDLFRARSNAGLAQPIENIIVEAKDTVYRYTSRYELQGSQWSGLVRALAVYNLMNFPGAVIPPQVTDAFKAAMAELREIRDGKFADVLAASTSARPTPAPRAGYGSRPVIPNSVYLRTTTDAATLAATGQVAGTNVQPGVAVN